MFDARLEHTLRQTAAPAPISFFFDAKALPQTPPPKGSGQGGVVEASNSPPPLPTGKQSLLETTTSRNANFNLQPSISIQQLQRDICSKSIRILHPSEPPPLPDPPLSYAAALTSRHSTLNPDPQTPHSTTQDLEALAPCNYSSKNGTPTPHPPRLSPSPSSSIISSRARQRP